MALMFVALFLLLPLTQGGTTFLITNNCPHTIWAASVPFGGGLELPPSRSWAVAVPSPGPASGRIWARTNCTFDASGRGSCLSGDCGGALRCAARGSSPATVVEYSLNQWGDNDFYGITLVDGFNVAIAVASTAGSRSVQCDAPNIGDLCPPELRAAGGCRSACDVFGTDEYCCEKLGGCHPTKYSTFFKGLCPNACSYPQDIPTSTYTCNSGGDYRVTFCP